MERLSNWMQIFESEDIQALEKERMRIYMKVKNWKKAGKDTTELEKQLEDAKKRLSDAKKAAKSGKSDSSSSVVTPQQTIPTGDDSISEPKPEPEPEPEPTRTTSHSYSGDSLRDAVEKVLAANSIINKVAVR